MTECLQGIKLVLCLNAIHQILSFEADFNRIGQREFFENFRKTFLDFESYYILNTLGNLSLFIKGLKLNLV
jgi:hypothetical protein